MVKIQAARNPGTVMNLFQRKKTIPVLTPLEAYNRWAPTYQHETNPIKELSDDLVNRLIPTDLTGMSFLDAGCGVGKFCNLAASRGASKIVGLDLSPAMIEVARQQCPEASFICGDLLTSIADVDPTDCILSALVLGHIQNLDNALGELLSKLKVNGCLILTDFHPHLTLQNAKRTFRDSGTGTIFEVRHHLHLFQDYFRIVRKYNCEIIEFEEPCFKGSPVVFGIQARKKQ